MDEENPADPPWQVTDLKQYAYCPRVVYYHTCLPRVRPTTYKMQASKEAHEDAEDLERRRSLHAYGIKQGRRHFDVWLSSDRLGLRGRVDMVIETGSPDHPRAIPVDYKLSENPGEHFQLQLAAYAVMLEEAWAMPASYGFLYLIPLRRARKVQITPNLRTKLGETLAAMNAILLREWMPPPTPNRTKCPVCEFRRFCNDVD